MPAKKLEKWWSQTILHFFRFRCILVRGLWKKRVLPRLFSFLAFWTFLKMSIFEKYPDFMMNFPCFFFLLTLHLKYKKNKLIYCTTLNTVSIGYEFSIFRNLSLLNKAKHHQIKNCETFEIFRNFSKLFQNFFNQLLPNISAFFLGIIFVSSSKRIFNGFTITKPVIVIVLLTRKRGIFWHFFCIIWRIP